MHCTVWSGTPWGRVRAQAGRCQARRKPLAVSGMSAPHTLKTGFWWKPLSAEVGWFWTDLLRYHFSIYFEKKKITSGVCSGIGWETRLWVAGEAEEGPLWSCIVLCAETEGRQGVKAPEELPCHLPPGSCGHQGQGGAAQLTHPLRPACTPVLGPFPPGLTPHPHVQTEAGLCEAADDP